MRRSFCVPRLSSAIAACMAVLVSLSLTCSAQAVPVLITTEGLPGIDLAQRDSAGVLRQFAAEDDNADGAISLVAELDPVKDPVVHISSGPSKSSSVILLVIADGHYSEPTPFFITGTEERTITRWHSFPAGAFALGQPLTALNGQIPGLDATIYRSPGVASAADVVDLDEALFTTYTGPLVVGGLVRYQVIPEPNAIALLAACGMASLVFCALRRIGNNVARA